MKRPPRTGPRPESVAAVRRLLGRLEPLAETFAVAALDDDGLASVATAVTAAVDAAGAWLVDRAAGPMGRLSTAEPVAAGPAVASDNGYQMGRPAERLAVTPKATPPPVVPPESWGDLFGHASPPTAGCGQGVAHL